MLATRILLFLLTIAVSVQAAAAPRSHLLPEPGTSICVEVVSHDGSKVEIRAVVRWTTAQLREGGGAPGFGVMIEQRTPEFLGLYESLLLG